MGEDTRARILDAAAELGWRPSAPARALTEARARAIGLLLARPVEQLEVDPFFVRFLAGVERTLARSDHALLLRVLDATDRSTPTPTRGSPRPGRVDGFLLCDVEVDDPRFDAARRRRAAGRRRRPSGRRRARSRRSRPRHARGHGRRSTAHLLELRARADRLPRRPRRATSTSRRGSAAWRGDARGGRRSSPGRSPSATRARPLADGTSTAIVCTSDVLAAAALARRPRARDRRPGELSITGFDDSPLAALASPPLTSVRIDYAQFGEAAAAALLAAIAGAPPPFEPAPPQLIVRASTRLAPGGPPRGS